MSDQPATEERPNVEFGRQDDVAFGDLLDALAPDDPEAPAGEATAAPGGAGAGEAGEVVQPAASGAPGRADEPGARAGEAGQAGGAPDPAAAGGPGDGQQPADGAAGGGTEQSAAVSEEPAAAGIDTSAVLPQLGDLSTKFEENVTKAYQQQAYETAREDYGNYFDALEKHPRLLVGTQVPAIGKEGMETLRSTDDAKEWQEAVKSLLVEEIRATAQDKVEESRDFLSTVHASIDLFKNNADLIPGTKGFDRKLADQFAEMAKPYEVRADGKLQGYSIPVQPIIDSLRAQLQASRTPQVPVPAEPPAAAASSSPSAPPPQAGITSKAGSSSEREDFSTLFGTIGLPNLQI